MASSDRATLINNTTLLARVAKEFKVPAVLTAVETESFSGYIWPQLLDIFPDQPVVFFADLRRRAEERGVRAAVRGLNPADAVEQALTGRLPADRRGQFDTKTLIGLGRQVLAEQATRNHLEG